MAELIVEVRDSHHRIKAIHSIEKLPLIIGRGYECDIIIPDNFVDKEHLLIEAVENGWRVTDKNTTNGMYIDGKLVIEKNLKSGDEVTIGKTHLRIMSSDHPVAPAKVLHDKINIIEAIRAMSIVMALLGLLIVAFASYEYMSMSDEVHIEKLIASTLPVIGGVLLWAAIWSLLAYIARRKLYFYYFLTVSTVYVLADLLLELIIGIVSFNVINVSISEALSYFTGGLLLVAFFYASMHKAFAISKRRKFVLANLFSWGLVAVIIFVVYANKPEFSRKPEFPAELKPPFARVVSVDSVNEFMADIDAMLKEFKN